MKHFHHIKYKEIDGYDELILIEHTEHNKINASRFGNGINKHIVKKGRNRTTWLHTQPHEWFQGAFCLIPRRRLSWIQYI